MKKIKRTALLALWIIIISAVTFLSIRALNEHRNKLCHALVIDIDNNGFKLFMTDEQIRNILKDSIGVIEGMPMADIDLLRIRSLVNNLNFYEDITVYSTLSGEVKIELKQRKPLVRVFMPGGLSYYIDDKGLLMPLSPNYSAHVIAATFSDNLVFNHQDIFAKKPVEHISIDLYNIFLLAKFIRNDNFWNAVVSQIIINDNDLAFTTKIGNHIVIVGEPILLEEKFEHLLLFYKQVLEVKGWHTYDTINLKFRNKVICS